MVMYSIFQDRIDGTRPRSRTCRQAERYLPDNIYDALGQFPKSGVDDEDSG